MFSRRFVKSFPALSTGFEIETELTIHALSLSMPILELETSYTNRPADSVSKLSTYSDGARILLRIVLLTKEERPFFFFSVVSGVLAATSLALGVPLIFEWLKTGLVPRFPTAILAASIMLLAFLAITTGLILDSVARGRLHGGGENLEVMREAVNYNRYLADLVRKYAEDTTAVLDFGAGIGTFSDALDVPAERVTCVEQDSGARLRLADLGFDARSELTDLAEGGFSYGFSLNVLEHIDDDNAAARELYRVLRAGGRFFVYVPAFQLLYSPMDAHVGHKRRYRMTALKEVLTSAGFEIERCAYTDALGFFVALAYKFLFRNASGELDRHMVRLYDRFLFPLSRLLSVPLARIVGKNVYAVALSMFGWGRLAARYLGTPASVTLTMVAGMAITLFAGGILSALGLASGASLNIWLIAGFVLAGWFLRHLPRVRQPAEFDREGHARRASTVSRVLRAEPRASVDQCLRFDLLPVAGDSHAARTRHPPAPIPCLGSSRIAADHDSPTVRQRVVVVFRRPVCRCDDAAGERDAERP